MKIRFKRNSKPSGLTRRQLLGFLGGMATVTIAGCFRQTSTSALLPNSTSLSKQSSAPALANNPACVVKPQQSEGPYFVDEKLNRSDVRSNPGDGTIKPGVPLRLVFQVSQVGNAACTPLSNATVDIWHCDATGIYSDVNDRRFNTVGQKFLRGYQTTDADGKAEFITIYPGSYPGRAVHIHFKIRTAAQTSYEFTSQLYFDDAITDQVQAQAAYGANPQRVRNSQDGIFQQGGDQLMLQLAAAESGYVGRFEIGLETG
jgi:protocatechuate 3,4-dioxygenase beta subunit